MMDEPRRPAPTLPMIASLPSRRGKIVAVAVPAFLVGIILAAHRPLLGLLVRSRARALGVELAFDGLEASRGALRLTGVRASLTGVRGVRVTATALRLSTSFLSVTSVDGEGVAVSVEGSAGDRVLDLASWSGEHADTYRLRGSADKVRVEWRARSDTPAWLTMASGSFTADGTSARFLSTATSAFGVPMGTVGASFAVEAAGLTMEAGKRPGSEAPLVATLRTAAHPPELAVTLHPVELTALGTALGLSLPARGAVASGHANLTLDRAPTGLAGTASLELDGYVPPHPPALDAIVFGKKTTVRSRLHVREDRATVKLDELEVRAGKLDLKGSGTIVEEGNHAVVQADIGGPIPCAALARLLADDALGGALGSLAGAIAGRAVGGSAQVTLSIEADTRNLAAAKVKPRVGPGCEVKLPGL
jgi:hypothetical protein